MCTQSPDVSTIYTKLPLDHIYYEYIYVSSSRRSLLITQSNCSLDWKEKDCSIVSKLITSLSETLLDPGVEYDQSNCATLFNHIESLRAFLWVFLFFSLMSNCTDKVQTVPHQLTLTKQHFFVNVIADQNSPLSLSYARNISNSQRDVGAYSLLQHLRIFFNAM